MDTMISLNRSCFLGNRGVCGNGRPFAQQRQSAPLRVVAVGTNAARKGERNGSIVIETAAKEVVELKSTVHGGDRDVYGEDTASEDQPVTPWCVSVARCVQRRSNMFYKYRI